MSAPTKQDYIDAFSLSIRRKVTPETIEIAAELVVACNTVFDNHPNLPGDVTIDSLRYFTSQAVGNLLSNIKNSGASGEQCFKVLTDIVHAIVNCANQALNDQGKDIIPAKADFDFQTMMKGAGE